MPSPSIQPLLDAAFAEYAKQIGIDPEKHPFADQLQTCHSPDDVLNLLEVKANEFKDYRDGNRKLITCLKPVVNVIHLFSDVLGEVVSMVPFQPAKAIFVGVSVLLAAASGVSSSYDALVELFECVGGFLKRLRIYTDLPLTPLMTEISVKIMVELLSVLALATKQIKQGRFKKFAKKLLGESEIEAVLQRLDSLTQEEGRMTVAQTLEVVHGLMNAVKVVMDDGKASMDGIWKALDAMQEMAGEINKISRDQLKEKSRGWLSPPDPSPNYNSGCETHQDGTATWFLNGSLFNLWNEKGSLLWIYGKPGSGKSILMSSIIREIGCKCKAGLASMAYFYFDFRDTQKQHRRGLLASLLSQLSAKSDPCYHIFSRLYFDHDEGARQPSDDALFECLMEMLNVQGQPATYLIIDALDECPNISGMLTAREKVLELLEELVGLSLPNLHICVSSRPEFDIRSSLEPLAPFCMLLDDESGQKADISGYINSVVHSDRRIRKWSAENKQLVIDTLSDRADGMFRWVSCQLEILRRCFPSSIRDTLESLPKTLDATYEHTLLGIDEEKWQFAHRLFQCLAVSVRPLRVEELAEILAVRFDPGSLPQFHTGWRLGDAEEAVLSACSSLIAVVNVEGSPVVQFAHFSVKEFLTSDRLASTTENFSRYHIVPHFAHTTLVQASLGVLLELDDCIDEESIRNYPLADYAARYWLDHCKFGDVTMAIQDATKYLFDRARPHFSVWIWIYDIDDPWRNSSPTKHPEQPEATPLYYSVLCGFPWLIEHLIATYPGDVNTRGGYYRTPLLAALRTEDMDVTPSPLQLLLEQNVDVNLPNGVGETPLFWASACGKPEIVQLLVERGANVDLRNRRDWTPLKMASSKGHLDIVRLLIKTGADVNVCDDEGWTSLHSASWKGHVNIVKLLVEQGMDTNQQNNNKDTPLHLASWSGKLEILKMLVERGADVDSPNLGGYTPLKTASNWGHLDVVRFLIDSGADLNTHDHQGWTPLHSALTAGHINITELLIQAGADVNQTTENQGTALGMASLRGELEVSRQLILRGASVECRDKDDWTPLKMASHYGHLDIVRLLIDSGADLNSHDNKGWTPLHSALGQGHINITELLIQAGADVHRQTDLQRTPLHMASASGEVEVSRLLVLRGASVECRDKNDLTPLKTASHVGHLDVVRFLIDRGADLNSHDNQGWTPLHSALREGHINIAKLLIQAGADVDQKTEDEETPLNMASSMGELEVSRLLVLRGASVECRDKNGWTPLKTASHIGYLDVVQFLIDSNADLNSHDNQGWTPLHSALREGHINIAELLIQAGADVNQKTDNQETPLDMASLRGELGVSKLLVLRGASVECRDKKDWTPLKTASHVGHLDVVRFLIDSGADLNAHDNEGRTPLHAAVSKGHLDVVELLLARGADSSIRDDRDRTPFDLIADNGNPGVGDFPFEQVADPMSLSLDDAKLEDVTSSDSEHQQCSVYSASQNGQLDIVRSLLDRGYDVNDRNTRRETALDVASRFGQLEVARLLIERGADVDARDRDGWTPLITASEFEQLEVAQLLLDHGASVNAKMRDRHDTALHRASFHGHFKIVTPLLEHGADVNVRNQDGQTPRQIAMQLGHRRIVELLSDFGERRGNIMQGAPTPHLEHTSPLKILAQTPVPPSGPLAPVISVPAPAPQFAADSTCPAASSFSLQGRRVPAPPSGGTSRTVASFPAWLEASNPSARPVPVLGGYSRQLSADGETDRDIQRLKPVGDQLQMMIDAATIERNKTAQTAQWMGRAPNTTIATQVLIGALATALGAALSDNDTLAVSILGGASILVVSYLVLARGSKEQRDLLLRVKAINNFLHEIEVFQLEHGHEIGRTWDEKVNSFRLGLENILGNQPGSITINSEAAGTYSGPGEEVRATNPGPGFNETG